MTTTLHIATIWQSPGSTQRFALSAQDLNSKVAAYCRESWENSIEEPLPDQDDEAFIATYFAAYPGEHLETRTEELALNATPKFDIHQQFDSPQQAIDMIIALNLSYDDRLSVFCDTVSANLRMGEGGFAGELASLLELIESA